MLILIVSALRGRFVWCSALLKAFRMKKKSKSYLGEDHIKLKTL